MLQPAAFRPRKGEKGLSVYRTDMRTPRGLLQQMIDDIKQRLNSDDEGKRQRAANMLEQYGSTVEEVVQAGWRVARIPSSAFTDLGFTIDGPDSDGHQNVIGDEADFKTHSPSWIDQAEVLSEEECLREQ